MKVQRNRGCKTASVQGSNLTIARSNSQEKHGHGTGGRKKGWGKERFMLRQPFLGGAIRPTTFFGTNQAEEEKLEEISLLIIDLPTSFLPLYFPSPLLLPVPNLTIYLSSVHSGILAPAKAARYCCKTPRMLLMNPLDKGKRGNPISG